MPTPVLSPAVRRCDRGPPVTPGAYLPGVTEEELVEEAAGFLQRDGQQVVRRYLRSGALPVTLFDDLVQEVLLRVIGAHRRGTEILDVEAFVATVARRTAVDLVRGLLRRPEVQLPEEDAGEDPMADVPAPDDPEQEIVSAEELAQLGRIIDTVRRRLAARLGQNPDRAAGALAVLAIAHGDAEPADDCPRPVGGVAADEATAWAGLFYGGADRCFPTDGDPEDAAMRKRRSRALARQRELLQEALRG